MVKSAVTAGGKLIGAGAAKAIGMMTAKEAGEVAIESAAKAGAESGAEIISRTAQEQANKGVNYLRKFMTDKEWRAFSKDPANGSRFLGKAVHEATAAALEAAYPGRFKYYRLGIDFLDKATGFMIELTTEGQVLPHMARDGYDGALYALYTLMNVL